MARRIQPLREESVDLQYECVAVCRLNSDAFECGLELFERLERDAAGSLHSAEGAGDWGQKLEWVDGVETGWIESIGARCGWVKQFQESGYEQRLASEGLFLFEECGNW